MKRYRDAEHYYMKALEHADTLYLLNQKAYAVYLGNTLINVGNLFININRYNDAKQNLQRAFPIIETLYKRSPDAFRVNFLSANIALGDVHIFFKEYIEAEPFVLRALDLSKENKGAFAHEYFFRSKT